MSMIAARKRAAGSRVSRRQGLVGRAEAYALLVLALVAAVFFSVLPATSATFPTVANFQAITGSQGVLLVAALAVMFPLICEQFDLSVGAVISLSAVVAAELMKTGFPSVTAAVLGVASGGAIGLINGLLVTRAKVISVVVTLGMSTILTGLLQVITAGKPVGENVPAWLLNLGSESIASIPQIIIAALAVALVVYYVLAHTPFGRQLYLYGANSDAARLVGLRTDRLVVLGFTVGGLAGGMGGLLMLGQAGSASPNGGDSYLLAAWAAAFLGAAAIQPGRFNVWGLVTAIAFLAILNGGLNLAGANPYMANFVDGVALIGGVAFTAYLRLRRGRRRTEADPQGADDGVPAPANGALGEGGVAFSPSTDPVRGEPQ
jgi:ribose transport system permease protein